MKATFNQLKKNLSNLGIEFTELNNDEIIIPAVCLASESDDCIEPIPFEKRDTDCPLITSEACIHIYKDKYNEYCVGIATNELY